MFLILIDAHSKCLDVHPTRASDSETTIDKLRMSFASWGQPNVIVTDNAQAFVFRQFELFRHTNGIRHL